MDNYQHLFHRFLLIEWLSCIQTGMPVHNPMHLMHFYVTCLLFLEKCTYTNNLPDYVWSCSCWSIWNWNNGCGNGNSPNYLWLQVRRFSCCCLWNSCDLLKNKNCIIGWTAFLVYENTWVYLGKVIYQKLLFNDSGTIELVMNVVSNVLVQYNAVKHGQTTIMKEFL